MKAAFSWEKPPITTKCWRRFTGSTGPDHRRRNLKHRTQAGGINPNRFTVGSGSPCHVSSMKPRHSLPGYLQASGFTVWCTLPKQPGQTPRPLPDRLTLGKYESRVSNWRHSTSYRITDPAPCPSEPDHRRQRITWPRLKHEAPSFFASIRSGFRLYYPPGITETTRANTQAILESLNHGQM